MFRAGNLPYPALVLRVDEREEQADRDALGARRDEPVERGPHRAFVERLDDLAAGPTRSRTPIRIARDARNTGVWGSSRTLVHLSPHLAPDLEGVAEPFGGDDPEPTALAFQHRVRRHRGAVRELREGAGLDPLRRKARDGRERGLAGVRGRARHLEHERWAAIAHAHHVGKGAADVHADPVSGS